MKLQYKIIDFHTHPFFKEENNICLYKSNCDMSAGHTERDLKNLGIQKICGSVISGKMEQPTFEKIKHLNDEALKLRDFYKGFYIPGFHVNPLFVKESIDEIERMHKSGVNLIGELVHYSQGWNDYSDKRLWEILEVAEHYKMVVNFHGLGNEEEFVAMDKMVKRFKNLVMVGAHPSEGNVLKHHKIRLDDSPNYYVDTSGGGISRHGLARHLIDIYGKERVIFGSDYPICNPSMYVGGIALDFLLNEEEKEYIFHKNAEKLLGIKPL